MVAPHVVRGTRRGIARRPGTPRSITTVVPPSRRITPTATHRWTQRLVRHRFSDAEWQTLVDLMGRPGGRQMPSLGVCRDACNIRRSWTRALNAGRTPSTNTSSRRSARPLGCVRCRCKAPRTGSSATHNSKPAACTPSWTIRCLDDARSRASLQALENARGAQTPRSSANTPEKSCKSCSASALTTSEGYTDGTFWPKDLPLPHYIEETLR